MTTHTNNIDKRFIYTFFSNLFKSGLNFITGLLLAKWLGPEDFGRMAFLLASFIAIKSLMDFASSSAFFTFISQKKRSVIFISYYWIWVFLQLMLTLFVVLILLPEELILNIWGDETKFLIFLALIASFLQNAVWNDVSQMAEASRKTIEIQTINVLLMFCNLIATLSLIYFGKLGLPAIFIVIIIEWTLASMFAFKLYETNSKTISENNDSPDRLKDVFQLFFDYCKPFVLYVIISFAYDFGDRWMLQNWGGSTEQAYYAISLQFSGILLIITTSILKIFWKEIAEANHKGDLNAVSTIYTKTLKLVFLAGCFICGFLIPWTYEIINLFLGDEYTPAVMTLMIMFLYPVHQSMGQINGALLYATGNTRIHINCGLVFMILGIISTYIVLAPKDLIIPGYNLGSIGLVSKLVVIQIIGVNVVAWIISKKFKWKFEFAYQIKMLTTFLFFGFFIKHLIISILNISLASIFVYALLYLMIFVLILIYFPNIIGLDKSEYDKYFLNTYKFIKAKFNF